MKLWSVVLAMLGSLASLLLALFSREKRKHAETKAEVAHERQSAAEAATAQMVAAEKAARESGAAATEETENVVKKAKSGDFSSSFGGWLHKNRNR